MSAAIIRMIPMPMLSAAYVKEYRFFPYIISQVGYNRGATYDAGTTYVQKFRALTSGVTRLLGSSAGSSIRWERTPIHAEGESDVYSDSFPSNHFDIGTDEPMYVEAGAVITISYTKQNRNPYRVTGSKYFHYQQTGEYTSEEVEINEAVIDNTELERLLNTGLISDAPYNSDYRNRVNVSDVASAVTYGNIQEGDRIAFNVEPVVLPTYSIENNENRSDGPQLRFTDMDAAIEHFGLDEQTTLNSATYADWTSIGNGLEAKGVFVKDADYFVLENAEWCVYRFDGSESVHYAASFTEYSAGVTSTYWRYYGDALKSYCKNHIDTANAGGKHYSSLYLLASKSRTIANSIWMVVMKSSTSGEDDIVIDNIPFSSIRSLFEAGSFGENDIVTKGRGFSYTYSTNYIYSGAFNSISGSSQSIEIRVTNIHDAVANYGIGTKFTLETDDYDEWTDLGGGLKVRGFAVKNHDCFVLIGPPEWIEYPELGIKIKAQPGHLLEVSDLIVPLHTLCSNSYHGWDYYVKTNGSVSGKAEPRAYKRMPHIYTGSLNSGDTEEEWYINGNHTQTNSISSTAEGILIPGSEIRIYATKMGGTFNVLGEGGWKYMRNGNDISENVTFDANAFLTEYLYEYKGTVTEAASKARGYGLPADWTIQDGDTLVLDVDFRNEPQLTLLNNKNRHDFFEVQLASGTTRSQLFDIYAGSYSVGAIYGGGMYYTPSGTLINGEMGYRSKYYNPTNYDTQYGFRFDFQTYIQNHPDEFPLTLGRKVFRFISENGSFGSEIDNLLTTPDGNALVVTEGDYFEFCIERAFHYGENDLPLSEFYYGPNSEGWTCNRVQSRGTFVLNGDKVLIAPLDEGGGEGGGEDIPTEPEYCTVTFDAETNGGTCGIHQYIRRKGTQIGTLPVATKIAHVMTGWFTQAVDGNEIRYNTVVNHDMTVYAQFAEYIEQDTLHKREFPYLGSGITHDILLQSRPKELDPALGNVYRVVVRGYFRNPQEDNADKHLGLYVLTSYDYKNWNLCGWKEKQLSDEGFHDIGCETYRATAKYIMVILTGQLADGSHIDKIDMTGIGRYNNKLK